MSKSTIDHNVRHFLGGSDIGAIMGHNPNRSALEVYNRILELTPPEPETPPMKRGKLFEPIAAQQYTEKTGQELESSQLELVDPDYDFLKSHIDYMKKGELAPVEIKIPGLRVFSQYKQKGLPVDRIMQLQWYMGMVCLNNGGLASPRCSSGEWVIFNTEFVETQNFPTAFAPELFLSMRKAAVKFWREHIEKRVPPVSDLSPQELRDYQAVAGATAHIETPEYSEALAMLREVDRLAEDHKYLKDVARNKLKTALGNTKGKYEGPGGRVYWTEQAGRKTIDANLFAAFEPIDRQLLLAAAQEQLSKVAFTKLCKLLDDCRLNISKLQKQGQPFDVIRAYYTSENE